MEEKFVVAAAAGEVERVRECIHRIGVNINWQDERGETALMKAARRGDGSVAMELMNARANCDLTNESGNTALHFACKSSHRQIVHLLGEAGADVNLQNSKGNTPAHVAASRSELAILDELNRFGYDWMIVNKEGRNALEHGRHRKQPEAVKIISNIMAGM
jgi:ankyrin repeat protein